MYVILLFVLCTSGREGTGCSGLIAVRTERIPRVRIQIAHTPRNRLLTKPASRAFLHFLFLLFLFLFRFFFSFSLFLLFSVLLFLFFFFLRFWFSPYWAPFHLIGRPFVFRHLPGINFVRHSKCLKVPTLVRRLALDSCLLPPFPFPSPFLFFFSPFPFSFPFAFLWSG